MVFGGLWTMLNYPLVFILLMVLFILLAIWLLPKIWRALKIIFRRVRDWLAGVKTDPEIPEGQAVATVGSESMATVGEEPSAARKESFTDVDKDALADQPHPAGAESR